MFAMFFIVKVILYSFMLTVLDLILSNDRKRDGSYEHLICQIGKYHFISISKYLIHIYRMYIYITSSYNIKKITLPNIQFLLKYLYQECLYILWIVNRKQL